MRKSCLILTLACGLFAANKPATFTGGITDTLCGRSHGMPAKFAAQRIKVTGTYDGKNQRIKVTTIEAAGENK